MYNTTTLQASGWPKVVLMLTHMTASTDETLLVQARIKSSIGTIGATLCQAWQLFTSGRMTGRTDGRAGGIRLFHIEPLAIDPWVHATTVPALWLCLATDSARPEERERTVGRDRSSMERTECPDKMPECHILDISNAYDSAQFSGCSLPTVTPDSAPAGERATPPVQLAWKLLPL